jgi:hypothetical protein
MEIGGDGEFCYCSESLNLGGGEYGSGRLSISKYDRSYNNNNNNNNNNNVVQ